MTKKLLFCLLVIGLTALLCVSALAEGNMATILFTNHGQTQTYWGFDTADAKGTTANVTGEGRYKVSVTFEKPIQDIWFCYLAIDKAQAKWPHSYIKVHTIQIDGVHKAFSKGFTFSNDGAVTTSLYDPWFSGINYQSQPRCEGGNLSNVGLMLKSKDFIGAKKIEISFSFFEEMNDNDLVKNLKAQRMDTKWNVVYLIFKKVTAPGHKGTFTNSEVRNIQSKVIDKFKPTVDGIANGLMTIGTEETIVIDDPIDRVETGGCPFYDRGGAADLYQYIKGKDVNLVVVFAPTENCEWLGLGGGFQTYGDQRVYIATLNDNLYGLGEGTWRHAGVTCPQADSALVHEFLHCVETNSRINGWSGFQELHSWLDKDYYDIDRGYGFEWFFDLMRNTPHDGTMGFLPSSYYVTHSKISK